MKLVIAFHQDGDAVEFLGGSIVSDETAASQLAETLNNAIAERVEVARKAQSARTTKRRELFGDKYPLSEEESAQLGPYPSVPVAPTIVVTDLIEKARLIAVATENQADDDEISDHPFKVITMDDLPPL